ncbi:MAG: hypothetical protein JXR83_06060 [Deltaproteobacteria bacterium]|nr:hypothetical protein [Deltaproteobacteria bacterium]
MLGPMMLAIALAPPAAAAPPAVEARCHEMYALCRRMLADKRACAAQSCFEDYLAACPEGADAAVARAMVEVAAAMAEQAQGAPASAPAATRSPPAGPEKGQPATSAGDEIEGSTTAPVAKAKPFSVTAFALSGIPELALTSTAFGGVGGFLGAAVVLSALRTSRSDSTPLIVGAPLLGAVGGLAASSLLSWWLEPTPGQAALFSSSMWLGTAYGIALQYALFDGVSPLRLERPERETPWRFATVLGTGALAVGTAALGSRYLPIDPGDVGLINSAALWGSLVPLFAALSIGFPFSNNGVSMPVFLLGTSLLAVDATVLAAPWVEVPRPATWLIDAGGVLGMLAGLATLPFLAHANSTDVWGYVFTLATAGGVVAGTAGSLLLGNLLSSDPLAVAGLSSPLIAPALLPDPDHPGRPPLPGLTLAARF